MFQYFHVKVLEDCVLLKSTCLLMQNNQNLSDTCNKSKASITFLLQFVLSTKLYLIIF